jgi:purine-binding chemotaxis protein CheW
MKYESGMREETGVDAIGRADPGTVDWAEIHRRLQASRAGIERRLNPGPDERRKILRERAKLLGREFEDRGPAADSLEVVEFVLASERYGVESAFVREIYPLKDYTPLPCTPPFVLGVINVRGQILSVIDIKRFFDLPDKGLTDLNKVVILETRRMELGVLADAVLGVRSVTLGDLQPSLPTLTGIRVQYLRGVTSDSMVVLDAEALLSDSSIIVDEDASRAP